LFFTHFQVYPWPTVDLIIPEWWTGTLELINPGTGHSLSQKLDSLDPPPSIPLVILPFNSKSSVLGRLNTRIDKNGFVSLPNLIIKAADSFSPIYFLGNRGGNYRSISVNAITGTFSGRQMLFAQGSSVSISIPQGDIILNTDNPITTDLVSLYSATRPVVLEIFPIQQVSAGVTTFQVSMIGINFRNLNPGDIALSFRHIVLDTPVIPDCRMTSPANMMNTLGSVNRTLLIFSCVTEFTQPSSHVQYNVFLKYFGGTMSLFRLFQVNVAMSNNIVTISHLLLLSTNTSSLPVPSASPNSMCAVGALANSPLNTLTTSGFVPSRTSVIFNNRSISMAYPGSSSGPAVTFSCQAARSLYLGSHPYSYGNKPDPQSLLGVPQTM
jgi:hypothetical protein